MSEYDRPRDPHWDPKWNRYRAQADGTPYAMNFKGFFPRPAEPERMVRPMSEAVRGALNSHASNPRSQPQKPAPQSPAFDNKKFWEDLEGLVRAAKSKSVVGSVSDADNMGLNPEDWTKYHYLKRFIEVPSTPSHLYNIKIGAEAKPDAEGEKDGPEPGYVPGVWETA